MHELFLSTQVANDDIQRALRILQGYCGMKPVTLIRRRLMWEGPRTRNLKGIDPTFISKQQPAKEPYWRSLHEQLIRQSYIVTLIYDVDRDQFGRAEITAGSDDEDISKNDEP
jgi:mediator of RNA polymerase II transcription subunit 18, fungi type